MSTNKTTKLNLNSWASTDYVKMSEFNDNFTTIDTEVGALKDKVGTSTVAQQITDKVGDTTTLQTTSKVPVGAINELSSGLGILSGVIKSIEEFPIQAPEVNDTGRFQRAFDYLVSKGGGNIFIPVNQYIANIKIPSNCGLIGSGRKSILKCPDNSTSGVIELSDSNVRNILLHNFSIDGNKANQTSFNARGIYLNGNSGTLPASSNPVETNDVRHEIRQIFIVNTKGVSFEIHGRGESQIHDVQVMLSDSEGMILDAYDNWYSNLSSGANKKTGITVSQNNVRLINCKSWNNGGTDSTDGYGFKITSADIEAVLLVGCEAQANANHGFAFFNARGCIGVGLNSELNGYQSGTFGIAGAGGYYFNASRENNIQGVCRNMNGNIQEYAVVIDGFTINNNIDVVAWSMKTGAINDISGNKDNNALNIINVTSGEVASNYRNKSSDLLRVNGINITSALAPFGTYSKEGQNILNALLQRDCTTLNVMQEMFRLEAYQLGNSNIVSRVKFQTQVNNGDFDIEANGTFKYNGTPINIGLQGSTASRPNTSIYAGKPYFDTTLNKPVFVRNLGSQETDTLTISAGATSAGNVTITLNGVATNVAVGLGDSTSAVATKIANTAFIGWTSSVSGSTVTFTSLAYNAMTAPSFSGGSTGVTGSFTVTTGGFHPTWVDSNGIASSTQAAPNVAISSGATTYAVTGLGESDANYVINVSVGWNTNWWYTNKTTSGFTINFGTSPGSASTLDWSIRR